MRIVGIALLIFITAFSQTKTRKVGSKSLKDIPGREITDGNRQLKAGNYTTALTHFDKAIKALDSYKTKSADELPKKYTNSNVVTQYLVMALYKSGKSAGKASKYKEADSYFERATKVGAESTKAWYEYGAYLHSRNKSTASKNALTNVIKIGESQLASAKSKAKKRIIRDMAFANYKLGQINSSSNPKKAIAYYNKAVDLRPSYYQPLLRMTKLNEEQKKWKAMLSSATKLETVLNAKKTKKNVKRKQLPKAVLFKGMAQYQLKKYNAATKSLAKVSKMNRVKNTEKNASFYFMGLAYKAMNNNKSAKTFFKKTKGAFKSNAEYEIDDIENGDKYTN